MSSRREIGVLGGSSSMLSDGSNSNRDGLNESQLLNNGGTVRNQSGKTPTTNAAAKDRSAAASATKRSSTAFQDRDGRYANSSRNTSITSTRINRNANGKMNNNRNGDRDADGDADGGFFGDGGDNNNNSSNNDDNDNDDNNGDGDFDFSDHLMNNRRDRITNMNRLGNGKIQISAHQRKSANISPAHPANITAAASSAFSSSSSSSKQTTYDANTGSFFPEWAVSPVGSHLRSPPPLRQVGAASAAVAAVPIAHPKRQPQSDRVSSSIGGGSGNGGLNMASDLYSILYPDLLGNGGGTSSNNNNSGGVGGGGGSSRTVDALLSPPLTGRKGKGIGHNNNNNIGSGSGSSSSSSNSIGKSMNGGGGLGGLNTNSGNPGATVKKASSSAKGIVVQWDETRRQLNHRYLERLTDGNLDEILCGGFHAQLSVLFTHDVPLSSSGSMITPSSSSASSANLHPHSVPISNADRTVLHPNSSSATAATFVPTSVSASSMNPPHPQHSLAAGVSLMHFLKPPATAPLTASNPSIAPMSPSTSIGPSSFALSLPTPSSVLLGGLNAAASLLLRQAPATPLSPTPSSPASATSSFALNSSTPSSSAATPRNAENSYMSAFLSTPQCLPVHLQNSAAAQQRASSGAGNGMMSFTVSGKPILPPTSGVPSSGNGNGSLNGSLNGNGSSRSNSNSSNNGGGSESGGLTNERSVSTFLQSAFGMAPIALEHCDWRCLKIEGPVFVVSLNQPISDKYGSCTHALFLLNRHSFEHFVLPLTDALEFDVHGEHLFFAHKTRPITPTTPIPATPSKSILNHNFTATTTTATTPNSPSTFPTPTLSSSSSSSAQQSLQSHLQSQSQSQSGSSDQFRVPAEMPRSISFLSSADCLQVATVLYRVNPKFFQNVPAELAGLVENHFSTAYSSGSPIDAIATVLSFASPNLQPLAGFTNLR